MVENIIKEFKIYNKLELYKWLMVSILHPSNQQFVIRYEFLLYTLLTIPDDNFVGNILSRKKFDYLIRWFSKRYSKDFAIVEDWEPFDQTKLIPIFFEKMKYYFFYGASERPYESIRQFQEILFTKNIEALYDIKEEFLFSLGLQTRILEHFTKDKESVITNKDMYVPSIEFFKKYSSVLKATNASLDYVHDSQSEYEMNQNNFNGLYVFIKGEYFILPPQCHIETLYQIGEERLYTNSSSDLLEKINQGFRDRSQNMIMKFFGIRDMLDGLIDPFSKENAANYFDSIARVDADKIVLFKYVPHSSIDLIDALNQVAKEALETLEAIKRNSYLGLQYINQKVEKSNLVPPEILNFTTIIIFEKLTLNYMLSFEKNWKENDIYIFNSLDFSPILELLQEKKTDTKISLLKYLEAEKKQSKAKGMFPKMDELDSFAAYYKNESFPVAGAELTLFFPPHEWSSFYNEYLFEKHKDNIYELVEMRYPNIFNVIKHASGDTYDFIDTAFITGGRCIKYKNRLLWILYPVGVNSNEIEVRTYTFLGEFFSYYLDKYKKNFFNLLNKYGFATNKDDFAINLYPDSTIKRNSSLSYLTPFLSDLTEDGIVFVSKHITTLHVLHVSIVYEASMEALINIFKVDSKENPEMKVFKKIYTKCCGLFDDR